MTGMRSKMGKNYMTEVEVFLVTEQMCNLLNELDDKTPINGVELKSLAKNIRNEIITHIPGNMKDEFLKQTHHLIDSKE